ncbi:MAG: tetratricopeptide repeat-containing sensor histidine kinase [Flavobacteriales bacterium]
MIARIFTLLLLGLVCSTSIAQTPFIDSLERTLPTLKGKERLTALTDLTWELQTRDIVRSERYGKQLMDEATLTKDSTEVGEAANIYTVALYRAGKFDQALAYNRRAYSIRKVKGDKRGIGSSLNKFVNIYSDQVKLDSALYYGFQALKIFEELQDSGSIVISLNTLGSIYQKDRNWEEMIRQSDKAMSIAKKIGFGFGVGTAAGNLGNAHENLGLEDKALEYYEIAKTEFEKVGSTVDLGTVAVNLGVIYRKRGDLQAALESYQLAMNMSEEIGEQNGVAHASANVGAILNMQNKCREAVPFFERAREISEAQNLGRVRLLAYSGLTEAYAKTGRGEESIRYLTRYINLRDSLYNTERSTLLSEMQTKFEVEKKEQENEFLKKENELKEQEKKRIQMGAIIVIVLLLIAAYFYYLGYKRKQETKLQKELVRERERGLEAVFDATEEERKRIAKDLHDGIGQQLSGLKLSWEGLSVNRESDDKMVKLTKVLDEACQEVRSISHQMMPKALGERGLLPALEDMLEKSLGLTSIQYQLEHFKVEGERFNERVEVGLYRVCQELVNNIIKHSGASQVNIQFFKNKANLVLIVEDNGKGFDPTAKKDGVGLMNITSRLSTVGGEVTWEAGPKSGSVATVRVSVA